MKTENTFSVCVVDDDDLFLKAMKHFLQDKWQERIKITLFHSGEEFLKYLQRHKPDIVILDYMLNSFYPFAMDGHSVLQKIQQTDPEAKVIMLSSQNKMEVALETMKNGAFDYIIKNDIALLKTQTSIKNAIESIADSKRLQNYKRYSIAAMVLIITLLAAAILI